MYLNGVPRLDVRQRNQVRRLVLLVDALYEARRDLGCVSRQDRISRLHFVDALYEARCALHVAAEAPLALRRLVLAAATAPTPQPTPCAAHSGQSCQRQSAETGLRLH